MSTKPALELWSYSDQKERKMCILNQMFWMRADIFFNFKLNDRGENNQINEEINYFHRLESAIILI